MKLYNLKLPKEKSKKEDVPIYAEEPYPYGTRLMFDNAVVKKIPALERLDVGDAIVMNGKGIVVNKSVHTDRQLDKKNKKTTHIEIQITDLGIADKNNYDDAFDEGKK